MPPAGLPLAYQKGHKSQPSWTKQVLVPIPGVPTRRLRIIVPNSTRISRKRGLLLICLACLAMVVTVTALRKGFGRQERWEPFTPREPSTLVYRRDDLRRIWEWEIASGHYPSKRSIPRQIGFKSSPSNPALPPPQRTLRPSRYRPPPTVATTQADTDTLGVGPKRIYLDIQATPPNVAYPPRPVPGSVADLDVIMKHCDFSDAKYVRDCLEVLRLGAGLDNGERSRRGRMDEWKYIYLEQNGTTTEQDDNDKDVGDTVVPNPVFRPPVEVQNLKAEAELMKKDGATFESQVSLPAPLTHRVGSSDCDSENPRLFHMFWTGPFTDKPYLALLSFLFTQNTGIHLKDDPSPNVCRPQFWLWINPGPAASVPNPNAMHDMFEGLKKSPWAAPFLHHRFHDVIKFKMWNTTEQLDAIPELKDEWRILKDQLFNSGGYVISVPKEEGNATSTKTDEEDILNRAGSKSSSSYDRLSVILSDMARFVLCHRFGGIYLDADTLFLRDWEELWGWTGAFAYRWSRLEKYNTAVLRMHKGSALGTFLFRTAMKNGLDFHPMSISRYTQDAYLEGLLLRLPDALFDSAWLNTEYYQRDRPPQPYFTEFGDFFDTPVQSSAAPQALGFHGFFRGAFSYHFHNFWWKPFDPSRNFPDLGPRFIAGEQSARAKLNMNMGLEREGEGEGEGDDVKEDKRDLDWSAVMKRTFEAYVRGERPNMYGEWIVW